jgi:hypothetical protein
MFEIKNGQAFLTHFFYIFVPDEIAVSNITSIFGHFRENYFSQCARNTST